MRQKQKSGQETRHPVWGGLCFVLAVLLALGWFGYTTLRGTSGKTQYQIINDEYENAYLLEVPLKGWQQPFTLQKAATAQGVRLKLATYNRTIYGRLQVELCRDDAVLARGAYYMSDILDGEFQDYLLDQSVTLEAGQEYRLHVWATETRDQDQLGIWASGTLPEGFTCAAYDSDRFTCEAAMALQLITDTTGRWPAKLYGIVAALLAAALLLAALPLCRGRCRPERLFVPVAALLGLAFALTTPPMVAPDEYAHLAESYAMASRVLGQPDYDSEGRLFMRACDLPYMTAETGPVGAFAYKQVVTGLLSAGNSGEMAGTAAVSRSTGSTTPYAYAPQVLGVLLARVLGLGFYGMVLLGRLCNLAVYLALTALALRWLPDGQTILLAAALLPMALQQSASFSPDALLLGLLFAFCALGLRLSRQKARPAEKAALVLLAALIGPLKAIYLPVTCLCFCIPAKQLGGARASAALKGGCCAAALLTWLICNLRYLRELYFTVNFALLGLLAALGAAALAAALWLYRTRLRSVPARRRAFWAAAALALLGGGAAAVLVLNRVFVPLTPEQIVAGLLPNGDSFYTFTPGLVWTNPSGTLKVLANSLVEQSPAWLKGLLGTSLGEPIVHRVEVNGLLDLALTGTLLAAALRTGRQPERLTRGWRLGAWAVTGGVVLLTIVVCLTWTPINYTVLFGVQGRYWLPLVPLALMALGDCLPLRAGRDLSREIMLCAVGFAALTAAQGFAIYGVL